MTKSALACIVLAAGRGTRMRSDLPKVLHPVAGMPMLGHVLKCAVALTPDRIVVVVGPEMENVSKYAAPHDVAVQKLQRGTADAVRAAQDKLRGFAGDVLVLYGDTPLVTEAALRQLLAAREKSDAAIVVAAFTAADAGAYGRVVTDAAGQVTAIVEALDATPEQRAAHRARPCIFPLCRRFLRHCVCFPFPCDFPYVETESAGCAPAPPSSPTAAQSG